MTDPAHESELEAGDMVGGYRIDRAIGSGGMGTVYSAEEPTIKRRVAVKVLRRRFADDAEFVGRFEQEARAAAEVRHPAIVDPFAFGQLEDGRPYFAMPLLEGESLRDTLGRVGKLAPDRAWRIAREVASGLGAAHVVGLVHRDLKPDNVFLESIGDRERIRILDFGIAKSVVSDPSASGPRTQTGIILGTPAYMAPEQWWGARIDQRTDQYALGVLLFEMLSGGPPFDPSHESGVMRLHLHETPPDLVEMERAVVPALGALVAKLLEKEPRDRFDSMEEVIRAGDAALGLIPIARPDEDDTSGAIRSSGDTTAPPPAEAREASTQGTDPHADTVAWPPREERAGAADVESKAGSGRAVTTEKTSAETTWRRWLVAHAAIVIVGSAALYAVGYAGSFRHDVVEWFRIAGYFAYFVLALAIVGLGGLVWMARRAQNGSGTAGAWALVVLPGIVGAIATYTGWQVVTQYLGTLAPTERFPIFNEGACEAGAARFLGFSVAVVFSLSLVALIAMSPGTARRTDTKEIRAAALAALGVGVVISILGAVMGAPSGALAAGTASAVIALTLVFPIPDGPRYGALEVERAVAGILAVLLAVAIGFERIAGREAILWSEEPSRAARVEEILAASAEREVTMPLAIAAVLLVLLPSAVRLRSLARRGALTKPRAKAWLWLGLLVVLGLVDVFLTRRFQADGEKSRAALSDQFALFAQLDPPSTLELDHEKFPLAPAPALQITRRAVAVNAERVVPLNAASSLEGKHRLRDELFKALADFEGPTDAADLSVFIDREVTWGMVKSLLNTAHAAGANRVELVLTRGPSPTIRPDAPPEAAYLLPADFVAVRAKLGDTGRAPDEHVRFSEVAPALVTAAQENALLELDVGAAARAP